MGIFTSFLSVIVLRAMWLFGLTKFSAQDMLVLPLHAERQFYCITPDNTYSYTWRVNRTWVTGNSTFPDVVYITSQKLSNGSIQGSLTFTAYAHVNNTDIECFVSNGLHILPQLDYNVLIQGYLPPPDVILTVEPNSARFSWNAPFSLNITDYEPDILYYVINIITADDKLVNSTNCTDTVCRLEVDDGTFSEYRVEIAAVNTVGIGEKYTRPLMNQESVGYMSPVDGYDASESKENVIESVAVAVLVLIVKCVIIMTVVGLLYYMYIHRGREFCSTLSVDSSCN